MISEITSLHSKALEAASRFKRAEADLIEILQQAERARLYFHLNYKSLFDYVVHALGLSEGTAYNLITVSRKAREVPALQTAIREGGLTVSKARKVTAVLTKANSEEWIQKAMTLSSRKLEEAVAQATNPNPERPVGLHLSLPRATYEKLKRAQELECQRRERTVSLEETLEALLGIYLAKRDPVLRANRILEKQALREKNATGNTGTQEKVSQSASCALKHSHPTQSVSSLVTGRVRAVPAASRHAAHARDQGRCTHVAPRTGHRCEERKWVHLHHRRPRSEGGTHASENLTTLCSAHHRLAHFRPSTRD